jgi:hypothetical protein
MCDRGWTPKSCFLPALIVFCFVLQAASSAQVAEITLSPFDDQGKFITTLTAKQLRVKRPKATIVKVELDTQARRIALVMDRRESPNVRTLVSTFKNSKTFAKYLIQSLREEDEVALFATAETENPLVGFTSKRETVLEALEKLKEVSPFENSRYAASSPALIQKGSLQFVFDEVIRFRSAAPRFGDTIVLLSDGHFVGDTSKMRVQSSQAAVRIFVAITSFPIFSHIRLTDAYGATIGELRREEYQGNALLHAEQLAIESGAIYLDPFYAVPAGGVPNDTQFDQLLNRGASATYRAVKQVYRVQLELAALPGKTERIEIEYLDENGRPRRTFRLLAPRYLPAAPPSVASASPQE